MRDNARALLIAAGGGFGDTFLASMCASALRSKYAAVDAVVLPGHIDALLHGADVDEIYSAMQPAGELAAELRGRRYAAAVVTWATPATALLAVRSGAPLRVGQARRLYSFLFNRRVVVRSELGDEKTHWSEILLDYPRALGCETALPWPRFEIRTEEEAEADELLRALAVKGEFIALHPVSAIAPRRPYWPVDGWRRVVERIGERYALPVVILGSAADAKIADRIAAGTGAISAVGRTTYGGLAAVARRAAAVVGLHSAPMHIAAAAGAPTVSVFPLRVDFPDRWRPLGPRVAIVRNSYPCPPGRAHRMETCARYECIAHLDVGAIEAAIEEVTRRPRASLRHGIAT
jgi:ADP-heptose:LPS heptosyltransferase